MERMTQCYKEKAQMRKGFFQIHINLYAGHSGTLLKNSFVLVVN